MLVVWFVGLVFDLVFSAGCRCWLWVLFWLIASCVGLRSDISFWKCCLYVRCILVVGFSVCELPISLILGWCADAWWVTFVCGCLRCGAGVVRFAVGTCLTFAWCLL